MNSTEKEITILCPTIDKDTNDILINEKNEKINVLYQNDKIIITSYNPIIDYEIYNIIGEKILYNYNHGQHDIIISKIDLNKGIYFIKLQTTNKYPPKPLKLIIN